MDSGCSIRQAAITLSNKVAANLGVGCCCSATPRAPCSATPRLWESLTMAPAAVLHDRGYPLAAPVEVAAISPRANRHDAAPDRTGHGGRWRAVSSRHYEVNRGSYLLSTRQLLAVAGSPRFHVRAMANIASTDFLFTNDIHRRCAKQSNTAPVVVQNRGHASSIIGSTEDRAAVQPLSFAWAR